MTTLPLRPIAWRSCSQLAHVDELAHVLRRGHNLVGAKGLVLLARSEGLTDVDELAPSWTEFLPRPTT